MTFSCLFPGAGHHALTGEDRDLTSAPSCSEVPAQVLAIPSTYLTWDSLQSRSGCFPSPPQCCWDPHGQSATCGPWMLVQVLVDIEVGTSQPVASTGDLLATRWNPRHACPLKISLPAAPFRNLQATQHSSFLGFTLLGLVVSTGQAARGNCCPAPGDTRSIAQGGDCPRESIGRQQ